MYKSFYYLIFILLFVVTSCSEEIIIKGDQQKTAIVFGLLDQNDSIHYIKINKAFNGSNSNALETALIPDSSYFNSVDATIQEINNGIVTREWKLRDTLVSNKEEGVFFYPEQKIYYFKTTKNDPLIAQEGYSYALHADINNGEFEINGSTELIRNASIGNPSGTGNYYTFASNNISKYGYSNTSISIKNGSSTLINTKLDIHIKEFDGNTSTIKTIPWNITDLEVETNKTNSVSANGQLFYELIKSNCSSNSSITKRQLSSIDITVTYASSVLQNYILLSQPSSSISQTKPDYTNLSVSNNMRVKGIFTSRLVIKTSKPDWEQFGSNYFRALDINSIKELCQGSITGSLLFCSDNPSLAKESFYCK